jgi:hypothetical protein
MSAKQHQVPTKTYEERRYMIAAHAWETWTNDGAGLDPDVLSETKRSIDDVVCGAYRQGISDTEWLAVTLKRLGVRHYYITHQDEYGERQQVAGAYFAVSPQQAIAKMLDDTGAANDGKWEAHLVRSESDISQS